ncbi:hypothetical protein GCM10022198_00560 [Klugiella xanthotipulae]|uniref:Site-specific recombinase XerD n=1 Tax=Klugiella xanthotipulae TaxID=244735 RepID=A0A543I5D7_9MICO|nr:site-specific integrase [Klugiella xanthotipulae]TQM65805.1 site-specific recombinase XerD [Klugiella xanthotipulae]
MAKAWIVDLWVKDATEIGPAGERIKTPPASAQLRAITKLPAQFRTAKYGTGKRWKVTWHEDTDGTQRQRSRLFDLRRDADEYAASMEDDIRAGKYQAPEHAQQKFSAVADAWISSKKKPKPTTIRRYMRELRMYVNPQWGNQPIGTITRQQIDAWVTALQDGTAPRVLIRNVAWRPLGPSSIEHIAGVVFGGVLRYAHGSGWLSGNAMSGVELPRVIDDGEDLLILNHIEVHALAEAAKAVDGSAVDETLVCFLAYTGLRINEALALRVGDLDLSKRRVRVLRTWTQDIDGKRILGPPKTWEKRTVPLAPFLANLLRLLVTNQEKDAWLFSAKRGGSIHDHNWRNRVWSKAVLGAGLDGIGLNIHKLRHTAASSAIAAGADVKVVQLMLGHKDVTETLNTYGHLWPDRLDEVSLAVDKERSAALQLARAQSSQESIH